MKEKKFLLIAILFVLGLTLGLRSDFNVVKAQELEETCTDGIDNDGDDLIDDQDGSECPAVEEEPEVEIVAEADICTDGIDNDGDDLIDDQDGSECPGEQPAPVDTCTDGIDNDGDDLIDDQDASECTEEIIEEETDPIEPTVDTCTDGIDNDGDDLIDDQDASECTEEIIDSIEDEEESNNNNGGGSSGGSSSGSSSGSVAGASTDDVVGEVAGAFTDQCPFFLNSYMKIDLNNDVVDVIKIQVFLNNQNISVPVTGFFGNLTHNAVKQFQNIYKEEVLVPWVPFGFTDQPTGYVFKTTKWKINNIVCPGSEAYPMLP